MPPKRMGRPPKTELQKLIDRAKALGLEDEIAGLEIPTGRIGTPEDEALEVEAAILFFDTKGKGFEGQICPECQQPFAYKYAYKLPKQKKGEDGKVVNGLHCSEQCRKAGTERRGIPYRPGRPPEARWMSGHTKGTLPLIVPPAALQALIGPIPTESPEDDSE